MDFSDYFSAGVPPAGFFRMRINELLRLSSRDDGKALTFTSEVCMIGLAAYFEAYCKDQFAAIINICPQLLRTLPDDRDFKISAKSLLHFTHSFSYKLGFEQLHVCRACPSHAFRLWRRRKHH